MIPAGYMAKRVVARPEWLEAPQVVDIYSVSNCVSGVFDDYIHFWQHNGYWFFNSPGIIKKIVDENGIDMEGTRLLYYEEYEQEWDERSAQWQGFAPEPSFPTLVVVPKIKVLEGYDVVTFSHRVAPECSPLSCNHIAKEVATNSHCLLTSFEEAKRMLESGRFNRSEPGPFRIIAVYSVPWE